MSNPRTLAFAILFMLAASAFTSPRDAVAEQMYAMGRSGDTSTLLSVTPGPFSSTTIGSTTLGRLAGLDFQPGTNTLFAASGGNGPNPANLFTVDPSTGAATLIGPVGLGGGVADLAIDNNGAIFGTNFAVLFVIDPDTGAGTSIGAINGAIEGLAVDPTTDTLYGLTYNNGELHSIDKLTGAGTLLGTFGAPVGAGHNQWNGFGINASGTFFGSVGGAGGEIFVLDPSDFSTALLGEAFPSAVSDIAFSREVIPEPASIALLTQIGLGLVGFGFYRARRKN
jgi:hypothetical protein